MAAAAFGWAHSPPPLNFVPPPRLILCPPGPGGGLGGPLMPPLIIHGAVEAANPPGAAAGIRRAS